MLNIKNLIVACDNAPEQARKELLLYGKILSVDDYENAGNYTRIYNMEYMGYKFQIKMHNGSVIYTAYVKINYRTKEQELREALAMCNTKHEKIMCKTLIDM